MTAATPLQVPAQPKVIEQNRPALASPCHSSAQPISDRRAKMPRKGTATVKRVDKYEVVPSGSDDDDTSGITDSSVESAGRNKNHSAAKEVGFTNADVENNDPAIAREQLKHSDEARLAPCRGADQPRQAPETVEQSAALASSLFPEDDYTTTTSTRISLPHTLGNTPSQGYRPRSRSRSNAPSPPATPSHTQFASQSNATSDANLPVRPAGCNRLSKEPASQPSPRPNTQHNDHTPQTPQTCDPDTMIQGGAFIPVNQQRNMRACMVCSIVRTQHQFMTQGCPNCEEILELANNSEQINDCTSQVFEGLISVADTNRSWVARYQRLEGYVPGVYATQVEGILPEDVLVAVENAGINYVPRDGSEQEMLGKD
jgi:transcription elongation factor SPT4